MGKKKLPKKLPFTTTSQPKATKTEREVLFFWTKEFLTIKQIANRRQTTTRAVNLILKNLRKKGYLNDKNMERKKRVCGINFEKKKIRFHALEFNIKILFKDKRYFNIRKKSNVLEVDGNTIRLFSDAIEVYIIHSFYSDSVKDARKKGFDYAYNLFYRLEEDLKVLLVKQRSQNIKLVKQHFAEVNNELAEDLNNKKETLSIKGFDGKEWILADKSLNVNELECVHPKLAEKDMGDVIKPFFDDLRKNPITTSEIMNLLGVLTKNQVELSNNVKEIGAGLQALLLILNPSNSKVSSKSVSKLKPNYVG